MAPETPISGSGAACAGDSGPMVRPAQHGVFRQEGDYWTVGYGGKFFRLKDTRGLGYLAHLLRHPAAEFHVLDLAGGVASQCKENQAGQSTHGVPRGDEELGKAGLHIGSLGDAGEMLDEQAKVAYRRRLSELREELAEAKELGNVERAEQTEQEIDALTAELSRAVGLGGRSRRAASASERARQSVTKAIKVVLEKIAQSDVTLGDLLSRCIKTGTFCSYQPDPISPIAWEFAATIVEPAEQPGSSGLPSPACADHPQAMPVVLEVSPFSLVERTVFVGRESEGSAIRAVIDHALTGHGSIVMLGGEPGVGKSRLAMEMAEYASRVGFRWLVGHCYERDEPFPYLPFVEIVESGLAQTASLDDFRQRMGDSAAELAQLVPSLRRVFPDIPGSPEIPPAEQRRHLFQSMSEGLARATRTRSYVFILEDLQWADEATLALLIHLANRVAQLPVVILGTYRSGYTDTNPALVRTLEELIRLGIRPLKLGGLPRDATAQMLDGLSQRQAPERLVSVIYDETQGNPFFVEEVYRHLIEEGKVFDESGQFRADIEIDEIDVPENVRLVIGRRLEQFDENEKRVLAAAAVIGRSFSFHLLNAISQVDVDELFTVIEKAQHMAIIVRSSEGPERPFTFRHELVRQTLLAGISAPRQQRMHASVAEAIERLNPEAVNERAGEIADHLLKAGSFADEQKLIRNLTLAGNSALEAAAFEEAQRSFRSVLSHLGADGGRERAELLTRLAAAESGLELWDAVFAHLNEALEIYIKREDREMIGRSFIELTDALIAVSRYEEATETARRGLAHLQADNSVDRARLLAAFGYAHALTAGYEPAKEALQEALNIASELSDPKLEARILSARSILNLHFCRLRDAAADGLRSEQLAGSGTPPWQRATRLRILHQALLYLGHVEEAMRIADELESLARMSGQSFSLARSLSTKAWAEFSKAPDLGKLETTLQEMWKSDRRTLYPNWEPLSEVHLCLGDYYRGNWTSALLHARAACRSEPGPTQGFGVGALFRQLAYAGDREGALAILDEKRAWLPRSGRQNTGDSWWMLTLVIEGLVILGEHSQAAQFYPLVGELMDTGAVVLWSGSHLTQTIAGIAAAAARQWETARDHFRIALQQAESFPHILEQAEIRRFHAMMLLNRAAPGDREKAQTLLNEALETYTQIGMPRHSEMTQSLLDRCQ